MTYKVVRRFKDVYHGRIYEVGDVYPAEGLTATEKRLEELSTTKNKYKKVYIEKVQEEKAEKEESVEEEKANKKGKNTKKSPSK